MSSSSRKKLFATVYKCINQEHQYYFCCYLSLDSRERRGAGEGSNPNLEKIVEFVFNNIKNRFDSTDKEFSVENASIRFPEEGVIEVDSYGKLIFLSKLTEADQHEFFRLFAQKFNL